ncbi:NYN domain-containing protein [Actinorugispora endophytica]|uniref:Putative RNA-binding protein with PIN domain n=1 Tax=Actinorugispora endophytica TaxID=1605990 RepID=A0A4R6V835_9ACTN|nr:NYN domain-containing protein [Actinorugispora endophytica]TDQ52506.1 putative RNA-binding protein with PIN domain [Actinorugispora endophytica]
MTADPGGAGDDRATQDGEPKGESLERPLPEAVRARVVEYGAEILGSMTAAEIPSALRRFAKFEPRRRARLAGPDIASRLESDDEFRGRVADRMRKAWPTLADGLGNGEIPPAADPVTVGAVAYLLRPDGWPSVIEHVHAELERQAKAKEADATADAIAELRGKLDEARAGHKEEVVRLRAELRGHKAEIAELRRKLHTERQQARKAVRRAEEATAEAGDRTGTAAARVSSLEAENRRLRGKLAAAEAQIENVRRAARTGRSADEARLRVLLDVLQDAAHGLRRELALPTSITLPADLVAAEARAGASGVPGRGLPDDDPGLVDQLLVMPRIHLLVDGYNVTKTGYGTLPLADQRTRLLAGLEGLATRTKAEITCVFDGAEVDAPLTLSAARRVRLLFSDPGETADELIIRLVRAEPEGRPLAVVTSDKEIIAAVRREGARTVASRLLLRRLD